MGLRPVNANLWMMFGDLMFAKLPQGEHIKLTKLIENFKSFLQTSEDMTLKTSRYITSQYSKYLRRYKPRRYFDWFEMFMKRLNKKYT